MSALFADILAIALLIFLFWNDEGQPDNWDKLDIIIQKAYIDAYKHN